jgi:hypothetical protein
VQCLQSFPEWVAKFGVEELDASSNTSLLATVIGDITNDTVEQDLAKLKGIINNITYDIGQVIFSISVLIYRRIACFWMFGDRAI